MTLTKCPRCGYMTAPEDMRGFGCARRSCNKSYVLSMKGVRAAQRMARLKMGVTG